jgi:hypothetical protein
MVVKLMVFGRELSILLFGELIKLMEAMKLMIINKLRIIY